MRKALHDKGLDHKGKKAELKQCTIDNWAVWEHEHEGGGASRTPPATAIAPLRSNIIEAAQTEPNTFAPPAEATPEGQNKEPSIPSEPEQAEAPPPKEEPTEGKQEEERHAIVPNAPCCEAGKMDEVSISTYTQSHLHTPMGGLLLLCCIRCYIGIAVDFDNTVTLTPENRGRPQHSPRLAHINQRHIRRK